LPGVGFGIFPMLAAIGRTISLSNVHPGVNGTTH